jgi:hypothetical protein
MGTTGGGVPSGSGGSGGGSATSSIGPSNTSVRSGAGSGTASFSVMTELSPSSSAPCPAFMGNPGRAEIGGAPSRLLSSASQRLSSLCPAEPKSMRITSSRSAIISSALA